MVPFSARLAHGYPQGELLKYIHFANNYMLTFRFCALSLILLYSNYFVAVLHIIFVAEAGHPAVSCLSRKRYFED